MTENHGVVVIAGSVEGIDALARLINLLPATFPLPLVANVHGLQDEFILSLVRRLDSPLRLKVVSVANSKKIQPGCLYIAPVGKGAVFTAAGVLSTLGTKDFSHADRLFESAALFYGRDVVGVVLSGLGKDGAYGLQAITRVNGIRIVQSPSETIFPGMPSSALLEDDVQYSVMLDQMGELLKNLAEKNHTNKDRLHEI